MSEVIRPTPDKAIGAELALAQAELETVRRERDEYRQEMFETNRYAAFLTHDRQERSPEKITVEVASSPYEAIISELECYISLLESLAWDIENKRVELARYIDYLEVKIWDAETLRVAPC